MATEFKLPELGENIESGDLVRLMIKPGGNIAEGEPVMELETDKAVVEVPSSVTGTVGEIRVKEGDKLRVGQVIFTVENGSGSATTTVSKEETKKETPKEKPSAQAAASPKTPVPPEAPTSTSAAPATTPPVSKAPVRPASVTTPQVDRRKPTVTAPTEFKLPELGENIDQGDLVRLMISPGSSVTEGQPVMELETDKAVVEVPSSVTGTVQAIPVKQGDKIKVGQVIFTFENTAKASIEPADPAPKVQRAAANAGGSSGRTQSPENKPASPSQPPANAAAPTRRATDANAPTEFKLPELGENISQGDLVRLMIAPGT